MKKLLCLILCVSLFLCAPAAYASAPDLASMSDEQLKELRAAIDTELAARAPAAVTSGALAEGDLGDYHVAILGAKPGKDYQGADCLIVNYSWSHRVEESKSFMLSLGTKAFQSGIQCELGIVVDGMNVQNQMLEIRSGATLEVEVAYLLRDSASPVEIEVSELFSLTSKDVVSHSFELPL